MTPGVIAEDWYVGVGMSFTRRRKLMRLIEKLLVSAIRAEQISIQRSSGPDSRLGVVTVFRGVGSALIARLMSRSSSR